MLLETINLALKVILVSLEGMSADQRVKWWDRWFALLEKGDEFWARVGEFWASLLKPIAPRKSDDSQNTDRIESRNNPAND